MKKRYFAICDREEDYVEGFVEYMNNQKSIGYDFVCFTNTEDLHRFSEKHEIAIILISEDIIDSTIKESVSKVFILTESDTNTDEEYVYKYQSILSIIKQISMLCSGSLIEDSGNNLLLGKCDLITVFSPIARTGKSLLSIALAELLAHNEPVLYISFEPISASQWQYAEDEEFEITDLVYYIRQEDNSIDKKIIEAIKHKNSFDFIPVTEASLDIRQIEIDDIRALIDKVIGINRYHKIIIELDELILNFTNIFQYSRKVYIPIDNDEISNIKLQHFKMFLKKKENKNSLNNIKYLKLPKFDYDINADDSVERLIYSNFGQYVRDEITEL